MRRSYVYILIVTALIMALGSIPVLAETVSENQASEEQQQGLEMHEEAEFSLSGYCGWEQENNGRNVSYTISDSDSDGIYDVLKIMGNGGIRGSGYPGFIVRNDEDEYGWADLSNPLPWQIDDNRLKLTKVEIGEGVTDINLACYCLRQLEEVSIPNSVTYIAEGAFYGCSSLEEIHLPDSVQSIFTGAFDSCSSLKYVNIPNGVADIGWGAFYGCTSLERILIPDSVRLIGDYAFCNCSLLKQVNIPNGVADIGCGTFSGCTSLEEIHLPDSVRSIGSQAFSSCSSLKYVNIPNGVTNIGYSIFWGCTSLEEIHLPDSVRSIEAYAFKNCSLLKQVNIPNGVADIGCGTFSGCTSLEEIHLPDSVQSIALEMFQGCSSLKQVNIPNGVTDIENDAFSGCTSLEEIHLPDSVQSIGEWAFYGCSSLKHINIPNGVMDIEFATFGYCTSLEEIHIPDGVTKIANVAFCQCKSLEEIYIPDSVQSIGSGIFLNCSSLRKVNIPNGVTNVSVQMYSDCTSLEEIHLPDSVQSIGFRAFAGCSSLKQVNIPNNVTYIGELAFLDCNLLKTVFLSSNCKNVEERAFPDTTSQIEYTIDGAGNAYIINIKLGKECTLVEIPDALYHYPVIFVNENLRSLVSETGHTHKYNEAGICQICNKSKEQDKGAGIDTDIPEGPDTWKSKEGVEGFVFRLYNVAMNRDADEAGFNDWNTRLNTGKETAAEVARGFVLSDEFKNFGYNDVQYVKLLYRTMFGREADEGGLNDWLSKLENGMSREYVFRGFAESQEFTNLCNSFDVERGSVNLNQYRDKNEGATGFVARLYTKMLGRGFDDDGLEYWCRKYLTGEETIEQIASDGFLHSQELDNLDLSDTEFVTRMYRTFLNREPDEAGLADWVNRLETGRETRDSLVYGFTLSKEFGNIKAAYGL